MGKEFYSKRKMVDEKERTVGGLAEKRSVKLKGVMEIKKEDFILGLTKNKEGGNKPQQAVKKKSRTAVKVHKGGWGGESECD